MLPANVHTMPFGASIQGEEVRFRLFAPAADRIRLAVDGLSEDLVLEPSGDGWHELTTSAASAGSRYVFVLPDGSRVPDPASRYQPTDVHGPSEVMDPRSYPWGDAEWLGRPWHEAVLYELHVGTFTREGTFAAAIGRLDHLAELGVTAIELMCLSDFAGNRNWGYDGVLPYAPDSAYGPPDAVKAFIDAAHARGLMVVLDVVYNHFGPEGNFIPAYFPEICSDRHDTPWGKSLNFDGTYCREVRDFVIHNALYWIEEFHVDGLRLDASHTMVDDSPRHILDELRDRVEALGCGRPIHLILENEQNIERELARDEAGKPKGYTAQWNHDITHLLSVAFADLCASEQDEGTAKLASALAQGFVIAAKMGGLMPCGAVPPTAFIAFLQTHDLVGNRIFGDRVSATAKPEVLRAMVATLLLLPQIPMLFMGEEWTASAPFPFFCDYHGDLADAVRKGRCEQLSKQDPAPSAEELRRAPDPQAESTLRSAQLNWDEVGQPEHAAWLRLYRELLAVRRTAVMPLLRDLQESCGGVEIHGRGAFTIHWKLAEESVLRLSANLCGAPHGGYPEDAGRVIWQQGDVAEGQTFGPWTVRWSVTEQGSGEPAS